MILFSRRTFCGSLLASVSSPLFRMGEILHADDFAGLDQWIAEMEKPGIVEAQRRDECRSARRLHGVVQARAAGRGADRVRSDHDPGRWSARSRVRPELLLDGNRQPSALRQVPGYDQLHTYYVGQGGNGNTTTRFRRYIGRQDLRPLLPEHDLRNPEFLLKPNVAQTIDLVAFDKRVQNYRDGKLIFDYTDADPYTHGHFALRTTGATWSCGASVFTG